MKISISHDVVILASESDAMLSQKILSYLEWTLTLYSYLCLYYSKSLEICTDNRVTFTIWFQLEVTQNRTSNRDRKSTCRMVFSLKRFDEFLVFQFYFQWQVSWVSSSVFQNNNISRTSSLKIKTKNIEISEKKKNI